MKNSLLPLHHDYTLFFGAMFNYRLKVFEFFVIPHSCAMLASGRSFTCPNLEWAIVWFIMLLNYLNFVHGLIDSIISKLITMLVLNSSEFNFDWKKLIKLLFTHRLRSTSVCLTLGFSKFNLIFFSLILTWLISLFFMISHPA